MIVFRYSKLDGGEFISHLDTMRHIQMTLIRAGIQVARSNGFAHRMTVNMSSPVPVGQRTMAEYCYVDTDTPVEEFKNLFNRFSPKWINCIEAFRVNKKCNIANILNRAEYEISGINYFDVNKVLDSITYTVVDKKDNIKEVRSKIYSLEFLCGGALKAVLAAGNEPLRADYLAKRLITDFGGNCTDILKTQSFIGDETVRAVLEREYV